MDDDKFMDTGDWISIAIMILLPQIFVWYPKLTGEEFSMETGIIIALITGGFLIISIFVKYWHVDRRQYKNILNKIGEFKGRTLEDTLGIPYTSSSIHDQLGADKGLSISAQLGVDKGQSISAQLGVHQGLSIASQLGVGNAMNKNLTEQHKDIRKILEDDLKRKLDDIDYRTKKSEDEKKRLDNAITPEQAIIKEAADKLSAMTASWQALILQNASLQQDNIRLQEQIRSLTNENRRLSKEISHLKDELNTSDIGTSKEQNREPKKSALDERLKNAKEKLPQNSPSEQEPDEELEI